MLSLKNKRSLKLFIIITATAIPFIITYFCLSGGTYTIYQNIFYIPVIFSCFWFGRKGLIYSGAVTATHFLFFMMYKPEAFWEELVRSFVLIAIGLVLYRLADHVKKHQFQITSLNKKLKSDIARLNKAEILSHLGSYEVNLKTGGTVWSDELFRMFGYEPGSFKPTMEKRLELTYPEDREAVKNSIETAIVSKSSFKTENRIVRADGGIRWVLSTGYIECGENGEHENFIGTLFDITDRKELENSLRKEKETLRITIASIGDGVISTDLKGNITIFNKVAEELTGWTRDEALGRPVEEVFNIINEETRAKCENPTQKVIESGLVLGLANHTALVSRDGMESSIADSAAPIRDSDGNVHGVVLVFRDITEEKRRQDEIYYMSYYDSLTGLYNRRYFEEELKRLDTERNLPISVIMGDANGLKITNDAFGHSEGDRLLKQMAKAIKTSCRADDIAARWGGDEFIILLPKTKKEDAEAIVKRIKKVCSDMHVDSLNVSIALGWDTKETKEQELSKVLKNAEDYMYKHKVFEGDSVRGNIVNAIFNTIHEKNPKIENHSKRVSCLCRRTGEAMGLPEAQVNELKVGGLLHDIGKVAIDVSILGKPGKLTENEWNEIKRHSDIGYRIINSSPEMADVAQYVLSHHEKYDGTGYPRGLKGEEIPLLARIIAVADSYDAMTNERSYRKILTKEMAVEELIRGKGTQFDPKVVDVFIRKVIN